ncbi:MAG: glycoside hydrolase family 2 protein, partial [Arachnia sp.]
MKRLPLHDGWTLRATGGPVPESVAAGPIPAQVPGTAHTDLLTAGLISDPYLDSNETDLVWAHRASWSYSTTVGIAPPLEGERVDLVCEGLDTVAEITLGDLVVGSTRNQHRTHRFDVSGAVAACGGGDMALTVAFRSALEAGEEEAARIGARPGAYDHPVNMVRKMACSFGWDWGPDLQTAGIWRPIGLERWRTARIQSVRPLVTIDDAGAAHVAVHVDVERSGLEAATDVAVTARLGDITVSGVVPADHSSTVLGIVVQTPQLWWPRGYGDQPLHDLTVGLGGDVELDSWHRRIGLRTVGLDTSDDEGGTAFTIIINGVPVFVKGAN